MLSKKLVPLAFGQGLDTKRDKKQQLFGSLRKAENVVFETLDRARKRNGYDSILLKTTTNSPINTAQYLSRFKNELLLFDQNKLYGFSDSLERMQEKGNIYSVFPTSWPILNNAYNHSQVDMLVVDGLKIFAYTNTNTNTVHYSIQDINTQTILISYGEVATSARSPKLANIGSSVYLIYGAGSNLAYKRFNTSTPATLSSEVVVANNLDTTHSNIDAVTVGSKVVIVYCNTNAGQQLSLVSVGLNDIPSNIVDIVGQNPTQGLDVQLIANGRLLISWCSNLAAKYMVYSANLVGAFLAPTTIESVANLSKIVGTETSSGNYLFYYTVQDVVSYNDFTKKATATIAGTVSTPTTFASSVSLASKIFWVEDEAHVLTSYTSELQSTYFLLDSNSTVVAKISPNLATGRLAYGTVPKVHNVSDGVVLLPTLYKSKVLVDNGEFVTLSGVSNTELDFVVEDRFQNAMLGNNLLIGGGVVQSYDSETISEHGFNLWPENPTLLEDTTSTPTNNSTRSMSSGDYGYCVVYKWVDNQGQEHRSAPSNIVSIVTTSGPSAVKLTIPTLRLTQKDTVEVEVYRTENNGTVFYLVNSTTTPFLNSETSNTVEFIDGKPDSAILTGRLLYTTGGVLENIAPPSARVLTTHTSSKRIFLAGLENPNKLQYSKITFDSYPVEFNDDLVINIDPIGGEITALASMDEKLVIFESDAIFFISGTGPNNAGQQNTFTEPERVSTDIGCLDPKSVVLTPEGLMFKSRKGIYLLGRALNLTYIGFAVEKFNTLTISSAKVVAELNQVRFTTIDGECLTYNYEYKFWSTFTNHKAKSAEVVGNDYYYLRINNELYKENRTSFSDAGVPIKMRVEIGWISFTTLQGAVRIYKMLLLGDWLSAHNLFIKVGYDFNEAWTQTATITPDTAGIDATAYGVDSPYGSPSTKPFGGFGKPYQVRVNFKKQKCQSIKLEIEDIQENAGEGFSLSQITFEVGGKSGLFKLGKGKKFATS